MNSILHVNASARGEESASYRLSQQVLARLRQQHPQASVIARDLWAEPLPHVDSLYSSALADFLEPYLRAILPTIGLQDLRFFSLQGMAAGPEATTAAQAAVAQELAQQFAA